MTSITQYTDPVPVPPAGRYTIVPADSTISFTTRHLFGLAPVRGTFAVLAGAVDVEEVPGTCLVQVDVDAASFTTASRGRDKVVCGPRFLDAASFPTFTFRADRVETADGHYSLVGTLTVRDVTRPVTIELTESRLIAPRDRGPVSFVAEAAVRIDRREFGVTASRGMAGRFLDIRIQVTCQRT